MKLIRTTTALCCLMIGFWLIGPAAGQQDNPVYVDDSPHARGQLERALEQMDDNLGEAVRLFQELLDESAFRVVPRADGRPGEFIAIRRGVLQLLQSDPALLERYRTIETPRAERLREAGAFEQLVATRVLTAPGLDALLTLAQRAVERAHFRTALELLKETRDHPDLSDTDALHAWHLTALAARHLNDRDTAQRARDALTTFDQAALPFLEQLDRLDAIETGGRDTGGLTIFDRSTTEDLSALVSENIWSIPLEESLHKRRTNQERNARPTFSRNIIPSREDGHLLTATATVTPTAVYISQGHRISAHDRLSGQPIWDEPFTDRPRLTIVDREDELPMDLSLVAVSHDAVVTLTGHAYSTQRSSDGRIICLDKRTGEERWSRRLDRLDGQEEFEGLFPHGMPIIHDGTVYLVARKVSAQSLSSCYVLAFDLESGQIRWHRHIVSSGAIRRGVRAFSALSYKDGALYVASSIGAVAKLTARTGETVWLRRHSVPLIPSVQEQNRLPWELSAPVVTHDRVIALMPGLRQINEYDRATGAVLASHSTTDSSRWGSPSYLLSDDEHLYLIGQDVRAFSLDDIEQTVWMYPEAGSGPIRPGQRPVRGRVQLTADALLIPTEKELVICDRRSGEVINRILIEEPVNAVADGAQLVAATADELRVYMSLDRAEELLRERIAADPADPTPAVSLLRLAIRELRLSLILESAQLAHQAIERAPGEKAVRQRQALFSMLLEVDPRAWGGETQTIHQFFDLMAAVAQNKTQQIAYRLAYGDWLAQEEPEAAITQYQSILESESLHGYHWHEDDRSRPARAWATERISVLIDQHGSGIYQDAARRGEAEFNARREASRTEISGLLGVAWRYPFAEAAVDSLIEASRRMERRGDHARSLDMLTALLRLTPSDSEVTRERLERYVGMIVEHALDLGRDRVAREVLAFVADHFDDPAVQVPGESPDVRRRVNEWRRTLEQEQQAVTQRPRLGSQRGTAVALNGTLLPRAEEPRQTTQTADRFVLQTPHGLAMMAADDLTRIWSRSWRQISSNALPETMVQLAISEREFLLQTIDPQGLSELISLHAESGEERWRSPSRGALFPEYEQRLERLDGRRLVGPDGKHFEPHEVIVRVGDESIIKSQRLGEIAALDRRDGTVRWSRATPFDRIFHVMQHGDRVVLSGLGERPGDAPRGTMIQSYDLHDGTPLSATPHTIEEFGSEDVLWLQPGLSGTVIFGSHAGVGCLDLIRDEVIWQIDAYDASSAVKSVQSGGIVLLVTDAGTIHRIDPLTGAISSPLPRPETIEDTRPALLDLRIEAGAILVRERQRWYRLSPDGEILGADAVREDRNYLSTQRGHDRRLLISALQPVQRRHDEGAGWRTHHPYWIYIVDENGRLMDETIELPPLNEPVRSSGLIDGWLLLSTEQRTIAVPFPPNDPRNDVN